MVVLRPDVELHIEELVLEDLQPKDRRRIGNALVVELEHLLEERGISSSLDCDLEIGIADAGEIDIMPGLGAEAVGSRVAGAVYGGLSRWVENREPV
ncbi:MAG TPA: hypothetical protein PLI05_05925 [Methanotrichaceae archaeon]|nr:hypothetical protein [Methanotrichaceae archaeon]HQI91221.1 hypothetical protein [Methanotrichaceae archaeon]HQJ61731.1 hypothetical protein [Methanothrix soehngenii]